MAKSDTAAAGAGPWSPPGSADSHEVPIPRAIWRLALVIVFGAFMSGLDASVVNVGLDTIGRDLDASLNDAQWVANGYLLALGVSLPACGWLGRRIGVGRLWLAALAAFTVTSGLCAIAPDLNSLIALRVGQGLAAGLLIPAGQTILGQAVGPHRLGRVMATLGLAVTLAPAVGPVVGGLVIHVGSWPWLFFINLPIGALGLLLGLRYVPRGEAGRIGRFDWTGLLLISAAIPLAVYGFIALGQQGTLATAGVAAPLAAGGFAFVTFAIHARRRPDPLLDLRLFSTPAYAAAGATVAFTGAAMFGAGLLFPLYFQIGRGESVFTTGLLLIALGVGTLLALPLSGRLVDRFGGGFVSVYGGLATVATTVPFAVLDLHASDLTVEALLVLRGMATGMTVMPAMSGAYKAVTTDELPDATTMINVLMRVGGALGGASFALIVSTRLPAGAAGAFDAAFWWLTAASAVGVLAACRLSHVERHPRPAPVARGTRPPPQPTRSTS